MNKFLSFLERRSGSVLVSLTLLFLAIECFYAIHRPLSIDEFNGAGSVAQVGDGVAYRDFQPYKPVLGYYLQLGLMRLAPDTWSGFLAIRLGMAFLSGAVLFLGAVWLRRLFRPEAVCLAYALLVVMTSLVEWGIEIRLDMLTALFGFASLLLLLNRRIALAGVVVGLGFLISQKGAMHALAGGIGLLGCLIVQRDRRWWRDLLVYGTCVVLPIGLYVLYWGLIASFPQVCSCVFAQQTQIHSLIRPAHNVESLYRQFWLETLLCNPLFYAYGLWALGGLLYLGRTQQPRDTLLLFYGATVVLVMLSVRQPWPYSFVIVIPTLFVLVVSLFSRELARPESVLRRPILWLCFAVLGLYLPLTRLPVVARDNAGEQKQTVELTEALLQPGDRYFAGFWFLPNSALHEQALGQFETNGVHPIQEWTAAEIAAIQSRFVEEPIRVVVFSLKVDELPEALRKHVYRNYAPFWANVWIYAPQVRPADAEVHLLFTDSYVIETEKPDFVRVDGQTYASGTTVKLERGRHSIETPVRLRLKQRPANVEHLLNPAYRQPTRLIWPDLEKPAPPQAATGLWVDD
jgi:hypothetical protein